MQIIAKTFDRIGSGITSLGAVIFVLLMVITSMIFFSHTLFLQVFPENMSLWEKRMATWVMALGWELTVLITTCNTRYIDKRIPWLMAIASGIIVLFFIQAFDLSLTGLQIAQRWFVGVLVATINWIYADLFYAKWTERTSTLAMPKQVDDLSAQVKQLTADLHQRDADLHECRAKLQHSERELMELRAFKKQTLAALVCPYCNVQQSSTDALRSHKGHCSENPKNKTHA
jgi:hypothetical protein